jgi:hypothetical protein
VRKNDQNKGPRHMTHLRPCEVKKKSKNDEKEA